jgi:CBS domain-containing protein
MKVRELMTPSPLSCSLGTTLAKVAKLMWEVDCGVIPVVDDQGRVTGIITDRDMCIFVAAQDLPARQIQVGTVASKDVFTCLADDDVVAALETMKQKRVRRLPVVDGQGVLVGMLSFTDIALAGFKTGKNVASRALVETYKAICERTDAPQPEPAAGEFTRA